jgi:GMP synthase-like glutamine amidotransferase
MIDANRHAVVVQHAGDQPAGLLADLLGARGLRWLTVRADRAERLPGLNGVGLIVTLGSDTPLDPDDTYGAAEEIAWLRAADRAGVPVLGVGFGAQALALALGGGIEPARHAEHGWIEVTSADTDAIGRGPWLAWHDTVVRLPEGADLLAYNDAGPLAFRVRHHLGLQFHPEVTATIVRRWVDRRAAPAIDVQGLLEATARNAKAAAAGSYQLFAAYLGTLPGLA